MTTVLTPPGQTAEQSITLRNVSWETYERLLAEHDEIGNPRFTYDRGALEIMVVSAEHERPNRLIASLFEVLAEEMHLDFDNVGSNTFKREDLARGFEPDTAFYVQHAERVRGKPRIDLMIDPPPDLVIEVDITHSSLDKLPIYAAVGVPEVWRYDGKEMVIFRLEGDAHFPREESGVLPGVTAAKLSEFVETSKQMKRTAWTKSLREWGRQNER